MIIYLLYTFISHVNSLAGINIITAKLVLLLYFKVIRNDLFINIYEKLV